jgi:hypothetical protein
LRKAELDFRCPRCGCTTPIDNNLIEQSPALKKFLHGSPPKGDDAIILEGLERNVRIIMRESKLERGPAILRQAQSIWNLHLKDATGREIADNPEALAKRWERKLRASGFDKRSFETLKPQGVLIQLLGLSRL